MKLVEFSSIEVLKLKKTNVQPFTAQLDPEVHSGGHNFDFKV